MKSSVHVLMMIRQLYVLALFACATAKQWNFLLIIVDDLKDVLGCYGDPNAHTPNIDRFARNAAVFTQAFAQQALCAPSRNSFLTSRRPDTLRLYDFYSYWRDVVGNFTTLPEHLRNHGYRTKSIGKVFHPGISSNGSDDSPYSWTDKPFHPYTNRFKGGKLCRSRKSEAPGRNILCPVKVSQMPNQTLPDLENVREAKKYLRDRREDLNPFFLAVGFQKPHIPLKYPRKYLRYHNLSKFDIPEPYEWPENVSSIAYNPWIDLRKRDDVRALKLKFPWERIPVHFGRRIIQSYYAAVTYIDDLIGEVLRELEESSLCDDTVVLLTSDHGWSLGEHAVWAKYSNFEVAVKVPFLLSIPGITFDKLIENTSTSLSNIHAKPVEYQEYQSEEHSSIRYSTSNEWNPNGTRNTTRENGIVIDSIIELVDIFPTIADLAGIPIPACSKVGHNNEKNKTQENGSSFNLCSEGMSLLPLVKAAIASKRIPWKKAAFWQYPRPGINPTIAPNSDEPRLNEIAAMGYSIRTREYRYTAWLSFTVSTIKPDWHKIIAEELYDLDIDPHELKNVVQYKEFAVIKEWLKQMLQEGYTSALP